MENWTVHRYNSHSFVLLHVSFRAVVLFRGVVSQGLELAFCDCKYRSNFSKGGDTDLIDDIRLFVSLVN